ncbi:MAG: hypothetical protein RQ833_05615 [Sphingomonadaceae bacterium]|nr:hypothetical protein [Sphingomonadaceae bacterium]
MDERIFTVKKVARELWAAEDQVEQAIAGVAGFTANLPAARRQMKFSAVVGQDALDNATAALAALSEARRHMAAMHHALSGTLERTGIRTSAFGPWPDKDSLPDKALRESVVMAA